MSSGSEGTEENETWIQWVCRMKGNEFFCEVDKSYIEDGFNLYGLRNMVPNFQESMKIILDDGEYAHEDTDATHTNWAVQLYGLIHARYIVTTHGLNAMHQKFSQCDFGKCPRYLCGGHSVVPLGQHVDPEHDTVKVFCPKCGDAYGSPKSSLDGAFFGPTFPHLFFMTFKDEMPTEPPPKYVPRVYGFRIHASSPAATFRVPGGGHLGAAHSAHAAHAATLACALSGHHSHGHLSGSASGGGGQGAHTGGGGLGGGSSVAATAAAAASFAASGLGHHRPVNAVSGLNAALTASAQGRNAAAAGAAAAASPNAVLSMGAPPPQPPNGASTLQAQGNSSSSHSGGGGGGGHGGTPPPLSGRGAAVPQAAAVVPTDGGGGGGGGNKGSSGGGGNLGTSGGAPHSKRSRTNAGAGKS